MILEARIDIRGVCGRCGNDLEVMKIRNTESGAKEIQYAPCETCMDEAVDDAKYERKEEVA